MATTKFLHGNDLWKSLLHLAANARGERLVATAYLGRGSAEWFPLRKGDTLLVALSLATARGGQVSPMDVLAFRERGVRVFRLDILHAKVYLLGRTVIVGSPNISATSRDELHEAGLCSTDPILVEDARRWFNEWCGQEIEGPFIDLCIKEWRPPRPRSGPGARLTAAIASRLWLLRMERERLEDESYERVRRPLVQAAARRPIEPGWTRWDFYWQSSGGVAKNLQPGDLVVDISHGRVSPYATVLSREVATTKRGKPLTWFRVASPESDETISWRRFTAEAKRRGVVLPSTPRSMMVRDARTAAAVQQLASANEITDLAAGRKRIVR